MRLKRTGWIGVALIVIGVVPLICWTVWFRTRTWCPVDMPVSLAQGSHFSTGEFAVNMNVQYEIQVASENKIPLDTLECLLGTRNPAGCSVPSALRLRWVLFSDGKSLKGTSDDTATGGYGESGPSGEAARSVGFFKAEKGRRYKLDIDVLADGSSLAVTNPHLRISVLDPSYESGLVLSGLLRLVCGVIVLVGAVLLVMSVLKQRGNPLPADSRPGPA